MQQIGGGWLKPIDNFSAHHAADESTWNAFLDECERHGVIMPSSYADVFTKLFRPPMLLWSHNAPFVPHFCGPWEEATKRGLLVGFYRQYDLNRAYRWAATQGLPDTATFRQTDRLCAKHPGFYVARLVGEREGVPHPYNREGWVMVTDAEIDEYSLDVAEVAAGLIYTRRLPGDICDRVMQRLSFIDDVAKCFWGMWAARHPIVTYFPGLDRHVPGRSIYMNLPWAHFIVSQIKMRVWEDSKHHLAHVFCDSVIVDKELPTTTAVGGWKLVTEFPNGVFVGGAGRYGHTADNLLKHAGTPNVKEEIA